MRKFLLILSCFIVETCVIERSVARIITAEDITLNDIINIENKRGMEEFRKIEKNKNDLIELGKISENYRLNYNSPFTKVINDHKDILSQDLYDPKNPNDLERVRAALQKIRSKFNTLPRQAVSVVLTEGISSANYGALLNVELDPIKEGRLLRPQTEKVKGCDVFASNPWKKIHQNLCQIKLENDFTNLSIKQMNSNERYVYNQNLGFLVWNAGLNAVETKLREAFEKAPKNDLDLKYAIVEQIRNAYYWAMLRNPEKADLLVKQYKKLYTEAQSKYYINHEFSQKCSIQSIWDIDNLDKNLKPLFESFIGYDGESFAKGKENVNLPTILRNKIDFTPLEDRTETINYVISKIDPDFYNPSEKNSINLTVNIGIQVKAGLTENSCFAICGSTPLLARGILSDPRLETDIIMHASKIDIRDNQKKPLESFARIAYSHFGYMPLVLTRYKYLNQHDAGESDLKEKLKKSPNHNALYGDIIFEKASIYPFLPIYLSTFSQAHYEVFCRNFFEMGVKREIKKRIYNPDGEGITPNLVNAYTNWNKDHPKTQLIKLLYEHQQLKDLVDNNTDLIPYEKFQENVTNNYIDGKYGKPSQKIYHYDNIFEAIIQELENSKKQGELAQNQFINVQKVLDDNKKYKNNNDTNASQNLRQTQNTILGIEREIQTLVNKMANNKELNATKENSIDPRLPMFSKDRNNFVYRGNY